MSLSALNRLFDEILELAEKNEFKGYDPLSLEDLYFVGRYLRKPSKLNKVLRVAEKLMLYFIPAENYLRLLKLPRYTLQYGDAILVQALVRQYKNTGELNYLRTAERICSRAIPGLIKTAHGLGVTNPTEVKNVKAGVSAAVLNTIYLPGSSEFVFAMVDMFEATGSSIYLQTAESIINSFAHDYHQKCWDDCVSLDYSNAGDNTHILNANALAAAAICRVQQITGAGKYDELVRGIFNFLRGNFDKPTLPYADDRDLSALGASNCRAYDVYHTGFALRGMAEICEYLAVDPGFIRPHLDRFFTDFVVEDRVIFMTDGLVNRMTCDIHGLAEFILVYSSFLDWISPAVQARVEGVIFTNLLRMRKNGQFIYRKLGPLAIKVYMPRWGEFPVANAIAALLRAKSPQSQETKKIGQLA